MKRSQALNLIANQLDFLNDKFNGARNDFTEQEIKNADVILTTLEHAGMLAPQLPEYSAQDSRVNSYPIENKWEEE